MTELAILGGPGTVPDRYRRHVHPQTPAVVFSRFDEQRFRQRVTSFDGEGLVGEVEASFCRALGLSRAMATNSGTSALYSMYYAMGLQAGDEVLVPAYTFFATAMPLQRLGVTPVLVDSTDNGNIDPADLERKITSATRAIVITHMWGVPCDMDRIVKVAESYGVPLLEDASHAHGATYGGQVVGTFGVAAAWSMGARKLVSGGQGGMLHSHDAEVFERAFLLSRANDHEHDRRITLPQHLDYAVTGAGHNLRMHPFAAAVISSQLDTFPEQLAQRRASARVLTDRLGGLPGLDLPRVPDGAKPAWYAFTIRYQAEQLHDVPRETFVAALAAEGAVDVDIPRSTCPLTEFRAFTGARPTFSGAPAVAVEQGASDFPGATAFHERLLKMPVPYGDGHLDQTRAYADAITKVVEHARDLVGVGRP